MSSKHLHLSSALTDPFMGYKNDQKGYWIRWQSLSRDTGKVLACSDWMPENSDNRIQLRKEIRSIISERRHIGN